MAVSSVTYNKPVLPRTTDGSDLGSNRASIYSGKGLNFDGVNDYVLINDFAFDPLDTDFTFSTYVRVDTLKDGKIAYAEKGSNDSQLAAWQIRTDENNDLYFQAHTTTWNTITWSGFSAKIKDKTVHLTFIRKGTTVDLYLNGAFYATGSGTLPTTLSAVNNRFCIGNRLGASNYLDGLLSGYKIFNTALTAAQVAELYNNPEQALPTGVDATSLVLHLPMTEGAGSYLYNANANAIGTELISNAGFDETCQKWGTTDDSTVEIAGGKAIWTNAPLSGSFVEQPLDLEVGKFYRVKFDYTSTAFNIFVNLGDSQQAVPLGNGTFVYDMYYGSGSSSLKFQHGWTTNSSATVDNVSVKEVVPNFYNGTINGATWVRSLPEPLPQTALMDWNKLTNLIPFSENFSGGHMAITSATVEASSWYSPFGDLAAADKITFSGSNARLYDQIVNEPSSMHIASCWFKSVDINTVRFKLEGGTPGIYANAVIDFNTGTISSVAGDYTATIESYDDGWYKVTIGDTGNASVATPAVNFEYSSDTGSFYVWGLQVVASNEPIGYIKTEGTPISNPVLIQEGSTPGKDVFGNTISNPRASGAYNFDGSSYVQGLNTGYLPTANEARSLELWVYHRPIPGATASQSLMEIGSGAGTNNRFGIMVTSPADTLYMVGQSNDTPFAGFSIPENQWTHIVATHDGTTLKVYKNGSLVGTASRTYATIDVGYRIGLENRTTSPTSIIGSYEWTWSQIANPRIYNYALTADQVADNFNEKASTFGGTKVASELDAYIERTASDGATVEAHSCLVNYLTELDKK